MGVLDEKRCKKNNLENNEKLQKLLGIDKNEKLTYFTLQKHMNKHLLRRQKIIMKFKFKY